jgi:hypothetical protein
MRNIAAILISILPVMADFPSAKRFLSLRSVDTFTVAKEPLWLYE